MVHISIVSTASAELCSPRACSKSFWAVMTDLCTRVIDFDYSFIMTKKNHSLEEKPKTGEGGR